MVNQPIGIMGWESCGMVRFDLGPPPSRSNDGSLALVSCLSGGYKFFIISPMRRSSFLCIKIHKIMH